MAKKESNTNKVPKLSDVIKTTISNINEITAATQVIVGSIENLANLIPEEFDENVKKIQTDLLKGVESIDKLVKVFANIDNGIKLDLKSLVTMRFKINILKQYVYLFMQMFETMAFYITQSDVIGKQMDRFKDSAFAGLEKQIELINNLELSTVTTKILMARLFIKEFKNLTEYLVNTLSSIYYDEFYKEYIDHITQNTKDIVDGMNASILALNEISFINLLLNSKKIPLMKDNIQQLLDMQISLSDKINKKKLEGIKSRLIIINDVIDNLDKIFSGLDNTKSKKFNAKIFNNNINSIIDIVDSLEKLNERLSKTNIKNIQLKALLETINAIYKIEKEVILISLLSVPFAAASILFLVGVTAGMMAILLTIKIIMTMANPALLRLARMSMKNLYKTIIYIAFVITATVLTIILITISALFIVEHIKTILLSIGVIGLVILALAGLGWLVGFATVGITMFSVGMIMLGVALVAITGVVLLLKVIANIKFTESDAEQAKENVKNILGAAKSIINSIFESFDKELGQKGEDGLILSILSLVAGDMFVNMIKLIMSCGILVFTVMAVGLVYLTAITLSLLQGNTITNVIDNRTTIVKNVREILGTAKDIIQAVFEAFDSPISEECDGALLGTASWVLGDMFVNMFKLIISCVALTFTVIAVALVKITAWALNSINNIEIDRATINTNAQTVMGSARDVIAAVNAPTDSIKPADKSIGRHIIEAILPASLINMVDAIMAIGTLGPTVLAVGAVGFMASQLETIQNLNINKESIKTKSEEIITAGNNIVRLINNSNELKDIDAEDIIERASAIKLVAEAVNELGKNVDIEKHTKITDNMVRFIDKIDKSKLESLQTAHNMFKEMKEFSESINGNFEGLAESLNEKIAPLLEELKELIGKIPESVDKSASTISGSMYNSTAIASGIATSSSLISQIKAENPSMPKEEVHKLVDQRMNQQAKTVNKGIEMKLEELIDVLQNYSNPIPVRMS